MTHKWSSRVKAAALFIFAAIALVSIACSGIFTAPEPGLSIVELGVLCFIVALVLLSRSTRELDFADGSGKSVIRRVGGVVMVLGALATAYAAVAFFVDPRLPPIDGTRLPSLYLLFGSIAVLLLGTAIRGLRFRRLPPRSSGFADNSSSTS